MFLFLLCDNKFVQFLSTGSSFLHIMIKHNVDFCKNELRFMPLTFFHLNPILLHMKKMTSSFVKNKSRGSLYLTKTYSNREPHSLYECEMNRWCQEMWVTSYFSRRSWQSVYALFFWTLPENLRVTCCVIGRLLMRRLDKDNSTAELCTVPEPVIQGRIQDFG